MHHSHPSQYTVRAVEQGYSYLYIVVLLLLSTPRNSGQLKSYKERLWSLLKVLNAKFQILNFFILFLINQQSMTGVWKIVSPDLWRATCGCGPTASDTKAVSKVPSNTGSHSESFSLPGGPQN